MSEKWTLTEAKTKLFDDDFGLGDLGVARRHLVLDISIAEVDAGLSVMLTPSDQVYEEDEGCWNFSFVVHDRDGVSRPELVELIARTLGIKADEQVWQDGEEL